MRKYPKGNPLALPISAASSAEKMLFCLSPEYMVMVRVEY
jgi:hypothetical protein